MLLCVAVLLSSTHLIGQSEGKSEFSNYNGRDFLRVIKLKGQLRSVYINGDMILSKVLLQQLQQSDALLRRKRWAYRDSYYPETIWKDGVPYEFDPNIDAIARKSLEYAMKFWEINTCVTFRPRDNETHYIYFTGENEGCFSTVGRDTEQPAQPVNIGAGCYHFGVTSHEVGHALGLFHHQQRYDRDEYVIFLRKFVPKKYWSNFFKIPKLYLDTYHLPYDIGSIMHYTPTEFAFYKYLPGLLSRDANYQGTMGSLDSPTFLDVEIINRHYQCYDACNGTELMPDCLNGGYPNPRNCTYCKCPTGFSGDVCQLIASSAPLKCGGLIPTSSKLTRMRLRLISAGAQRRQCIYLVRAPPHRRVMIGVQSVDALCQEGCFTTAVEMKMSGDYRPDHIASQIGVQGFPTITAASRFDFGSLCHPSDGTDNCNPDVVIVVLTPDAEDATYLNETQLQEVYKQTDENGVDMDIFMEAPPAEGHANSLRRGISNGDTFFHDEDYVGEFGSDGESYEDFSDYS